MKNTSRMTAIGVFLAAAFLDSFASWPYLVEARVSAQTAPSPAATPSKALSIDLTYPSSIDALKKQRAQ